MPLVELVYEPSCPSAATARARLLEAFARTSLPPRWLEYRIGDAGIQGPARGFGSLTVLVEGRDVAGAAPESDACCRLYALEGGRFSRVPSVSQITLALARATRAPQCGARWGSSLAVLPGIGSALLPKLACPACWPAYAGLLGSLGLGALIEARWLLPLTASFLVIAVGALAFRAGRRRGYAPFGLGLVASAVVLGGKFAIDSAGATYAGIALLVGASLWNAWPRKAAERPGLGTSDLATREQGDETMTQRRRVEVFSAGCSACEKTIDLVNSMACPSCEVTVLDMRDAQVAKRARALGVRSVPAVVIDGRLAECCTGRGVEGSALQAAGLGQPIP